MSTLSPTPRSHLALLAALFVLCVTLRWTGIDHGLPHLTNYDERVYLSQYLDLREPLEPYSARPRHHAYPDVWMRAAAVLPRAERVAVGPGLDVQIEAASADLVFLRRCVAVLGSLVVVAAWLLARRFLSSGWSLAVAALAGLSVFSLCRSTEARPHAVACTAIVFAVVAAIDVARKGTVRQSLLAALGAGASIAVLQSGAAATIPFVVAHLVRVRTDGVRAVMARFAAGSALLLGIVLIAYPAVLERLSGRVEGGQAFLSEHQVRLADFRGGGVPRIFLAFWNHDPLLWLACVASIVVLAIAWMRRREPFVGRGRELTVVLAFVLPFLVVLGLFQFTYYRFVLPLFPFAALFAVLGMRALGRFGPWICGVVLLVQAASVVHVTRLHVAPDTAERAAAWIAANVERDSDRISISQTTDVPLLRTSTALAAEGASSPTTFAPWIDFQRTVPVDVLDAGGFTIVDLPLRLESQRAAALANPRAFLRGLGSRFLVLEVFDESERPLFAALRRAAREEATLVESFVPEGLDAQHPHTIEIYANAEYYPEDRFIWRALGADALGPYLEIYRFDP